MRIYMKNFPAKLQSDLKRRSFGLLDQLEERWPQQQ